MQPRAKEGSDLLDTIREIGSVWTFYPQPPQTKSDPQEVRAEGRLKKLNEGLQPNFHD